MAQQMRALMAPPPVALPGTASVPEVARARRDAEMGDVIAPENAQVYGMGTDREIVMRTVAAAQDPATTTPWPTSAVMPTSPCPPGTASRRRCSSCAPMPYGACLWSTGGSRGAWCRSGIWQWSGSRTRY